MEIVPSLWRMPVALVRSSGMAGNASLLRAGLIPAWMTSIFTGLRGLRLEPGRPMHTPAIVEAAVHVFQEVRDRAGRSGGVEFDLERAQRRLETHADGLRAGLRDRQRQRAHHQRGDGDDSPGAHLNSAK